MKLIIDTDPGVDDALAILYAAAHPQIELLGLTTVFGNVTVQQATRNALYLVERAGLDIPVAEGAAKALALPPATPSHNVHGPEGFGGLPVVTPKGRKAEESAAEFLVHMARAHKGDLVLCPIGPITNIAKAIELDPEFASNVQRIVFMGGALDAPGNISPHAEANTYHDPHALDIVLQSGANICMVGLDVTMQVLLTAEDFEELEQRDPAHGAFLREMSHFYLDFYRSVGVEGCGLHDPLAVMACIMPGIVGTERAPLQVTLDGPEVGNTLRCTGRPEVEIALSCDAAEVKRLFMQTFGG